MHNNKPNALAPDYEGVENKMWRENVDQVVEALKQNNNYILDKIKTYKERFGYQDQQITDKIFADRMFRACFAKAPGRQGIHEKIAGEFLSRFDLIKDFKILPKSGKNAIYLTKDGSIVKGENLQDVASAKSLDFKWKSGEIECYASHKYTKQSGGSQDNQYNEQANLLRSFLGRTKGDIALFVICDGDYYSKSKMEYLNNLVRHSKPLSFACNIQEVVSLIDKKILEN